MESGRAALRSLSAGGVAAGVFACLSVPATAATMLVGPGSDYANPLSPNGTQDSDVTPALVAASLGSPAGGDFGSWTVESGGGVSVGALGVELARSVTRTRLEDGSLIFGQETTVLGDGTLGDLVGVGATSAWEATFNLDAPGSVVSVMPNTTYMVSVGVNAPNGLLDDTLGVLNSLGIEVLDGGTPLAAQDTSSLVGLLGLIGSGPSQTATFQVTTGETVTGDALGIRFSGSETLSTNLLDLGTDAVEFNNLEIQAVPEPSPIALGGMALGLVMFARRRR